MRVYKQTVDKFKIAIKWLEKQISYLNFRTPERRVVNLLNSLN